MMTFIIVSGYDRKHKAERMRLPDYMFCNTCKSTLLTHFFRNSCFTKKNCGLPTTYKFELGISWFSINHRNIDNHFSYESLSSSLTTLLITTSKLTSAALKLPGRQTYRPGCQDNRYLLAQLLKAELLQICKQHKPTPSFLLDNILKEYGHDCLRLPAYHADLNSTELYLCSIGKIVNKQRNVCDRIPDSRYGCVYDHNSTG